MPISTQLTQGEKLFLQFCQSRGVRTDRLSSAELPTGQRGRRPDFKMRLQGGGCIVEVKDLSHNKAELLHERELRERGSAAFRDYPGERVRDRLRDAVKNFRPKRGKRNWAERGVPTLVVLYDQTPLFHTSATNVFHGMFGEARVNIRLNERGQVSKVAQRAIGGHRVLTEAHNTSISAVGVLDWYGFDQPVTLTVYHNPYAKKPIAPERFASLRIKQFCRAEAGEWEFVN